MTKVQSPIIGNALRQALGLDAAGGMPMEADTTIVPVAIVADVREQLTTSIIPSWHYSFVSPAVAAEYPYCQLEWAASAAPRPFRLLLDKITVWSPTAQVIWVGEVDSAHPITQRGLPRRKQTSLLGAALAGRVGYGTTVTVPGTFILQQYISRVVANEPIVINFDTPLIIDKENSGIVLMGNTVNTELYASFEWREDVRS